MARRDAVTVIGVGDLRRELLALAPKVAEGVRRAVADSSDALARDASARAPRATGALAAHVEAQVDDGGLGADVGFAEDQYYGMFQELGTSEHPASPFLGPAAEAERPEFPNRVRREVRRELGD